MFHRKLLEQQLRISGLRIGDGCNISPYHGKKKTFTLNRKRFDIVSARYRPDELSISFVEVPTLTTDSFHYRLELDENCSDEGRFMLKTLKGRAFWLNGLAAREAYIERSDKVYIDDNRLLFTPFGLQEMINRHFDHPILSEMKLIESDLNILIMGETGTGKTHLARKIHEAGKREGNFVHVNLSSYNPQLIESELFGHRKGAFTGAVAEKRGAFEGARNGTLFLDEIDSLPLDLQTKLLTFLDNKKFRMVGDTRETSIKTRLIFASGRPLLPLVEQSLFRKDFYYRLRCGHTLELPSLRNENEKIKDACQWFCLNNGISITPRLLEFYLTLAWPGNLRQLFGHLEKKKVLSRCIKLDFDNFDEELLLQSSDLLSFESTTDLVSMKQVKAEYVRKAIMACEGNYAMAARKLRLSEKTIRGLLVC